LSVDGRRTARIAVTKPANSRYVDFFGTYSINAIGDALALSANTRRGLAPEHVRISFIDNELRLITDNSHTTILARHQPILSLATWSGSERITASFSDKTAQYNLAVDLSSATGRLLRVDRMETIHCPTISYTSPTSDKFGRISASRFLSLESKLHLHIKTVTLHLPFHAQTPISTKVNIEYVDSPPFSTRATITFE
jgi:hypothetical protein